MCAVSLASAVVGMIDEKDLRFIFHIAGSSTTGKTTGLMFAASMWGCPRIANDGVLKNWNSTGNDLVNSAVGNNGVPVCLDELSMTDAKKSQLTYLLTGGSDKRRMYENDIDSNFRTIFMSSGEINFKETNFGGIAVRLIETKGVSFTDSKEQADKLTKFMFSNYGTIGAEFAKVLSQYSTEKIEAILGKLTQKVIKRIELQTKTLGQQYSPLFSRIAEKIATALLAAKLSKKHLKLNFNLSEIADFLITKTTLLETGQEQAVSAVEKFMEIYLGHRKYFPQECTDVNVWGKTVMRGDDIFEIVVLFDKFTEIMKNTGYPDISSLLRDLREKGLTKCETGKNYCRRTVGNVQKAKVVVINVHEYGRGI